MLSLTSVSVSRLMLSIRSLAAGLQLDPVWLLSNAELSRVHWRRGAHDGELIVEIDARDDDVVLDIRPMGSSRWIPASKQTYQPSPSLPRVYTTVVGTYDDSC